MAARRDKRHANGREDRRTTFGIAAPPPADDRVEVMSVSARAHPEPHSESPDPDTPVKGDDVFLTPRVLDERAFQKFAEQLRSLIADAESASTRLEQAAAQNNTDRDEAARSSQQLQERLRLSARMLKAVQVQSEAIEKTAANAEQLERRLQQLNEQVGQCSADHQQRADEAASGIEQRIDAHADEVLVRLRQASDNAERLLQELDQRMGELMPRAERLCQLVETAEVNIAALAHRSADNARKAQQVGQMLADQAEQCRRQLGGIDQHFDRLEELNRILSRAEVLQQRWSATLEHLGQSTVPPAHTADSTHSEVKADPASIGQVVEELRRTVGEDMAQLTSVVHDIAARVDRLQALRSGPRPQPAPEQPADPIDTPRIETRSTDQHHST